ncbi:lactadherin-like [Branchiostoma floridae]|uniref:Lactadherin-like n=1 Tax=Branchiostoma floridae TaxID=7739 RepID=A0A9J7KZT8_BRAFL|nr:lactadherin-like [Branchiostoma floridae]
MTEMKIQLSSLQTQLDSERAELQKEKVDGASLRERLAVLETKFQLGHAKEHNFREPPCTAVPLGMESGAIPDGYITASTTHQVCATSEARLHSSQAWCANNPLNTNQWLQVDVGAETTVAGVITQGRPGSSNQWVTSYKLRFSRDGVMWSTYLDKLGRERVFPGNSDQDTEVRHLLDLPVTARYVRFWPQTWNSHLSMRVEVLGQDCTGD